MRSRDKRRFLAQHPFCCLCGGETTATTVEHAPALAMFVNRDAKGAFKFPACARCNNGSSELDQVAAASVLIMGGATASHVPDYYIEHLLSGVANNSPDFIRALGGVESEQWLRINGVLRHVSNVGVSRLVFERWLNPWAAKLALAFWYHEVGTALSESGGVFVHWIPNASFEGHAEFFKKVAQFELKTKHMRQGRKSYADQFWYQVGVVEGEKGATMVFSFHESAALWVGVFKDFRDAMRYKKLPTFRTSAKTGIYPFTSPTGIEDVN